MRNDPLSVDHVESCIEAKAADYVALSDRVWGMPELRFEEYRSIEEHIVDFHPEVMGWIPPFVQVGIWTVKTCDRVWSCIRPVLRHSHGRWPVWSLAVLMQNHFYGLEAH